MYTFSLIRFLLHAFSDEHSDRFMHLATVKQLNADQCVS
jgi:hypothetical protein